MIKENWAEYRDLESVLFTEEQIAESVKALGAKISEAYKGLNPIVVCTLKGAVVFYSDLLRCISLPVIMDFISASSYGNGTETTGTVTIRKDMEREVKGRDVILVEDIVDTGVTLYHLKKMIMERGAHSVRVAALLDKPARRRVDLKPDFCCFTIPDAFVVGYGLDYDERYRNLPDIGILSPAIYLNDK